jgi:hypothetical protein
MKNVFERWAEIEPGGVMRATPEELDMLLLAGLTKIVIGTEGVTVMVAGAVVQHQEYLR